MDLLLGAALAGYEDANALDHLCWGTGALGQKDVSGAGTIKSIDGSRNDHRGEARVELLGATDKLVAVHLGHDEVAEEKIQRAREHTLNDFERLLGVGDGDNAIATGFEQEGADGKNLFVVVDAKDRLLRAHGVSLLPHARCRGAADGPMSVAAGWQWRCTGSGQVPRGSAGAFSGHRWSVCAEAVTARETRLS